MNSQDWLTLTDLDVERCESRANSYTYATLEALGVSCPPIKGWKRALRGKRISRADYERAMAGRSKAFYREQQAQAQPDLFACRSCQ